MTVNTVSLLVMIFLLVVLLTMLPLQETTTGDDKLFLRGEGSLAVVELFDKTDVKLHCIRVLLQCKRNIGSIR
jgi:hypothetical protein